MTALFRAVHHSAARSAMGPQASPPSFGPDEALRSAHRLAVQLRAGAEPSATTALFASSGLGTLNVLSAHGGPALSFDCIAHVVRIVAEADRASAEAIRQHLLMVAAVNLSGTLKQRADLSALVLRGLRFGRPVTGPGHAALRLAEQPGGLAIEGPLDPDAAGSALPPHLLPIRVRDARERVRHAIVEADAVSARRRDPAAPLFVPRHRLLSLETGSGPEGDQVLKAIRLLLRAAVDAGTAGRALSDRIGQLRDDAKAGCSAGAVEAVGGLHLKLDAAMAVLEKAGRAVDRALIRPTASSMGLAEVAAAGARILAAELVEQNHGARSRVSALRGRRIGRPDPARSRYALLGAFYLNGVNPQSHAHG